METFSAPINTETKSKLNFKLILLILTAVVLVELGYLGYVLTKTSKRGVSPVSVDQSASQRTVISLNSDMNEIKVGDKISVGININSIKFTEAIDIVIKYDPDKLTVLNQTPVLVGSLYDSYPVNKVDQATGKISVSGIAPIDQAVVPNGEFGRIEFIAKAAGVAEVSVDFAPNETKDTNILEIKTAQDVLEAVEGININILP